jgi:hypothetical protein
MSAPTIADIATWPYKKRKAAGITPSGFHLTKPNPKL